MSQKYVGMYECRFGGEAVAEVVRLRAITQSLGISPEVSRLRLHVLLAVPGHGCAKQVRSDSFAEYRWATSPL